MRHFRGPRTHAMLAGMASPYLPPPMDTATDPIHSADDLCLRWRALMGELGFGEPLLRFAFVGPDRCLIKVLHDMPVPDHPTPRIVDDLFGVLRAVIDGTDPGITVALLLTRPGTGGISERDRRWATLLHRGAARYDVPIHPIFRANDRSVVLVEPDRAARSRIV